MPSPVDATDGGLVARLLDRVHASPGWRSGPPARSGRRSTPSRPSRPAGRPQPGPCPAPGRRCRPIGPSARPRSGPLKVLVMIESDPGIRNAAPAPCTPRKKISSLIDCDRPAPIDPSVNTTMPAQEHALSPEHVAQPAAGHQQHAEHQRVGVDRPRQVRERRAEARLDRRQRDVHDGVVEHHHEQRETHRRQRPPLAIFLGYCRHQRPSSFSMAAATRPKSSARCSRSLAGSTENVCPNCEKNPPSVDWIRSPAGVRLIHTTRRS